MTTRTFYRAFLLVPIIAPLALVAATISFDPQQSYGIVGQVLVLSLFYGGIPYALLALWAAWWIGRHPDSEIHRLMLRAPVIMAVFFATLALIIGTVVGAPRQFAGVAALGAGSSLVLGYFYVGVALLLRRAIVT